MALPQESLPRAPTAMLQYTLAPADIGPESGLAWITPISIDLGPGDSSDQPERSTLILFEDDHPLVPAHSPHHLIRSIGKGAYSYWYDALYFSTSDGSDPRENGRVYRAFADIVAASASLGRDAAPLIAHARQQRLEERCSGTPTPFNQNCDAFGDPIAAAQYDRQIYEGWTGHLERWAGRATGLSILELGPGLSLGAQALLAERGNRVTVADPFPPPWRTGFHPTAYRHLAELVGGSPALERAAEAGSFAAINVRQLPEPAEALTSLRKEEFDVVLSNATLEHVADLDRVCAELARVTRQGGLNLHQIDLSYHKDRERPLAHLLLSDPEFLAEARSANYEYGNRWRKSEFVARFNRSGFATVSAQITQTADRVYLAEVASLRKTRGRYGRWPLADLGALSMFLVARRSRRPRSLIPILQGHALVAMQNWRKRPGMAGA